MDRHSKTYEQYCWVKGKNIVMEETVFHNGERKVICTAVYECDQSGGCKNKSLKKLWCRKDCPQEKCEELTNGQ